MRYLIKKMNRWQMFVTSKPTAQTQTCSLITQEWRLACQLTLLFDVNRYNFVNMYPILMILVCNIMFSILRNTIMTITTWYQYFLFNKIVILMFSQPATIWFNLNIWKLFVTSKHMVYWGAPRAESTWKWPSEPLVWGHNGRRGNLPNLTI